MISTWAFVVALVLFGFVLLMLELFVIPGFGVTGIAGIGAILGAVYYANAHLGVWQAVVVFIAAFAASIYVLTRATKAKSLTKLKNPATSPGRIGDDADKRGERPSVGARGVAVTPLRPAGIVRVGDARYDVVADGPIVEPGQMVEIVACEGNIIRVKAL